MFWATLIFIVLKKTDETFISTYMQLFPWCQRENQFCDTTEHTLQTQNNFSAPHAHLLTLHHQLCTYNINLSPRNLCCNGVGLCGREFAVCIEMKLALKIHTGTWVFKVEKRRKLKKQHFSFNFSPFPYGPWRPGGLNLFVSQGSWCRQDF